MSETKDVLTYASGRDAFTADLSALAEYGPRASALLAGPAVSLHDHPVRLPAPLTADTWAAHRASGRDVLAGKELANSPLDVVVASCLSIPELDYVRSWAASLAAEVAAAPGLTLGLDVRQLDGLALQAPSPDAPILVFLGLEDLGSVSDLRGVEELYALGIRSAGISYNTGTAFGGGLAQEEDLGLTGLGRDAVSLMNELGMVIDVSHAGDRTALETAEVTGAPLVISHAGARQVWPSARMKPDEVIQAIAATGGIIGIEAAPGSTRTSPDHGGHDVDDVVRHIEYCAELVGVEHVGLGGDTFYGDHVGFYRALGSAPVSPEGVAPFDGELVPGAENPTEVPVQLVYRLLQRGWSDQDVARVLGGNALAVMRRALAGSRTH
ncbi:MAG: hypothetical protein JWR66_2695 [Modestobacter sp.]|jgi:membrane dipeptidase|nr:hypothetical protein [Modestobacter sp.]